MRKIGMVLAMLVCAMMAHAGTYAYLVFTNTESTKTALSVTDMTMTVNGTKLDVTNADGTEIFGGQGYYPASVSGGTNVDLTDYVSSGGGGPWGH